MVPRPSAGTSTMGSGEVTGMGIASVDHQVAISRAMPTQAQAASFMPAGGGRIRVASSRAGPSQRPKRPGPEGPAVFSGASGLVCMRDSVDWEGIEEGAFYLSGREALGLPYSPLV